MFKHKLLAATALALIAAPAYAQLEAAEDDTPIVISGTVATVDDSQFTMNYAEGAVTVEMNDWDWFAGEEKLLNPGDQVVVTGEIDDDLFEGREIEAETIYLVSDAAYYYGDEQDLDNFYALNAIQPSAGDTGGTAGSMPATGGQSWVSAIGTVQKVEDNQFTIDAGRQALVVDTAQMTGEQQIEVGEKVYVAGMLDQGFFDNREIKANRVVTLAQGRARAPGAGTMEQPTMTDAPAN